MMQLSFRSFRFPTRCIVRASVLLVVLACGNATRAAEVPRLYGASSLTGVLEELAQRYAETTHRPPPVLSLQGSSRLARQLQGGAPADIVITADDEWMDVLEQDEVVVPATRRTLLRNSLVVVVPRGAQTHPRTPEDLLRPRVQRIALAAQAVPAGRRAREALTHTAVLEELEDKVISTTSVRAALALVVRAEVDAAVVYATDALASPAVDVAFEFDSDAHRPIVYPVSLTQRGAANEHARAFYDFLSTRNARSVFEAAGFQVVGKAHANAVGASDNAPSPGGAGHGGMQPVALSIWVAALSLLLSAGPALVLGWLMARREFLGKTLLSTALLTPLVLPPVVTGYLLLAGFGRNGVFAPALEAIGLSVAFSRWGAVLAAAVVGFPLLILMTRLAIESVDPRYEQVAETLGMRPLEAFLKVTVPMAAPGLAAGAVLAFARGLGEFGATAIIAGDVPGETRTLSLAVYALYEQPGRESDAAQLVWISLGICLFALAGYERLSRIQKRRIEDRAP